MADDEVTRGLNDKRTIWQEDQVVNGRNGKGPNPRGRNGKGRNGRGRRGHKNLPVLLISCLKSDDKSVSVKAGGMQRNLIETEIDVKNLPTRKQLG